MEKLGKGFGKGLYKGVNSAFVNEDDEVENKNVFKERKEILKEIENKQARVIIFYKRLKDGSKERLLKYSVLSDLEEQELENKMIKLKKELGKVFFEELEIVNLAISRKLKNLTSISIVNVKEFIEKICPKYEIAFNYFYEKIEMVNIFLKKHSENLNIKLKDSELTLFQFAKENNLTTELKEMLRNSTIKNNFMSEENGVWAHIDALVNYRFGEVEKQRISAYATDLPDTIIEHVDVEIKSWEKSFDDESVKEGACLLSQGANGTFQLKYHPKKDSKIIEIQIGDVTGLEDCLGTLRDVVEIEDEKKEKAKALIGSYVNDKYHYDDFFLAAEKVKKEKVFDLFKIGKHLEEITDRENENHLLCTGKTFFRMKCYEKAFLYFSLASEKYSKLLVENPNSPYYDYQVNLMQFLIEKLKTRNEKDLWMEEDLIKDENYPKTLNFRLAKGKVSLENLEKLTHINKVNLKGSGWSDRRFKELIQNLNEDLKDKITAVKMADFSKLSNDFFSSLLTLKNLNYLNISRWTQITSDGFKHLKDMKNLTHLNLSNCSQLVNADLENIQDLTTLTQLNLNKCDKLTNLDSLKNLNNLIYLNLYGCTGLEVKCIENLQSLNKMMFLVHPLSWHWDDTTITKLANFANLTFLNINKDDKLSNDSIEQLFKKLDKIEHLSLNCKELMITNLTSLEPLKLKTLSLINAEKLKSLESLYDQKSLTYLNISGFSDTNNEFDEIVEHLENLKKYKLNNNNKFTY
jgi:hypothetical protein